MTELRKELDRLAALGSPDAIAAALAADDCKGFPERPRSCPIAVHLAKKGFGNCVVVSGCVMVAGVQTYFDRPLRQFVANFDARVYPFLIAAGPATEW